MTASTDAGSGVYFWYVTGNEPFVGQSGITFKVSDLDSSVSDSTDISMSFIRQPSRLNVFDYLANVLQAFMGGVE